jgi:UDP-N-acetylglucosamine 2-epimerase (non-hydrolysing)
LGNCCFSVNKIAVIFGTRPEAIKLAPVVLAFQRERNIICRVCATAQHRQMLDQVLDVFGIVPDVDLDLMRPNQSLAALSSRTLEGIDGFLNRERPDLVMVQGDTTTTFMASLAAFYHQIPVAHVEAGLRTGNRLSPWPEEMNRLLATRLSTLHLAATELNRDNLIREGVPERSIFVTGNPVIDALMMALAKARANPPEVPGVPSEIWRQRSYVLITGHRRESFGPGFESICRAIAELAHRFPQIHFIYPVHLNPNVREPVQRILGPAGGNIWLTEPAAYLPFVALMERSTLLLTDSGGIQEEGPTLGKPVIVMRETTERPEGVQAGTALLVGTDCGRIVRETGRLLSDQSAYQAMCKAHNPFGDGKASARIVAACTSAFRA